MKTVKTKKVTVNARHKWDVLEDMLVCSMVASGQMQDKKARKRACKDFGVTDTQLLARANNFVHILTGRNSFWHTSKQEKLVVEALKKHNAIFKI